MAKIENVCDCECLHKDITKKAIKIIKLSKNLNNISEFFKTFGDETRLKIILILDKMESMCVNDIAVSLNMTKSAISHQLKYLKDNKLVKSQKLGKEVFYSLIDNHVKTIFELGAEHIGELR